MIEFTANVICEDEPFFLPPHAVIFQPSNVGGGGYIVSVEAGNSKHAEHIIRAMFPRGTIDDGPHEVYPVPEARSAKSVHEDEFPAEFIFCPICSMRLFVNNAVTGAKFCPAAVGEECGDCGRLIFYSYDDESWHHMTAPEVGCFLIPPRRRLP